MENQNVKVVEINGCKFEVDLATARKVEEFKIGDKVKVLIKVYSDSYDVYPGVIIGFEWFETLPTITIAYLKIGYKEASVEFLYYNEKTKDKEISHVTGDAELLIQPSDVMSKINQEITSKEQEIRELKEKQKYFLANFGKYFNGFSDEKLQEMMSD
jgi:ribosomal protein L19